MLGGCLDNFSLIKSCDHSPTRPTYHSTFVRFDDQLAPDKLEKVIFASDCVLSPNLHAAFLAKEQAGEIGMAVQEDNMYRILKVGFRSNAFAWKSESVYRKVTIHGRYSLQTYMQRLCALGVIRREPSRTGPGSGYVVSDEWQLDARKLIEDRNVTPRLRGVLAGIESEG